MTEVQQTRPSTRQRLLQLAAIVSALSIVGSYVAWSQYQAGQRAKLKRQTEQALAAKAKAEATTDYGHSVAITDEIETFEGFVDFGSPVVTADGLALSSKSISKPVFSTRLAEENKAPEVSAHDLIGGSKSWAHVTVPGSSVPLNLGEGFEVPTEEKPSATAPYSGFEPAPNAGFGMISGSKSIGRHMTLPIPTLDESEDEESSESDAEGQ